MRISFELAAEFRDAEGKGASRRLRHAGQVPAILYGGSKDPRAITLNHQKLMTLVDNEKFYSSIINLKSDRDAGRHRQGPADAPGAQRHRARRPAARRGDGEDPHPHPDPLQGRSRVPGP
jgi:large subunit ribosomal protein L25